MPSAAHICNDWNELREEYEYWEWKDNDDEEKEKQKPSLKMFLNPSDWLKEKNKSNLTWFQHLGQTFPPNLTTEGVCVLYTHWSWKNTRIPKQSPLSLHHRRCFVGFVSKIRHYDCNATRYSLSLFGLWRKWRCLPSYFTLSSTPTTPPFFFS